LYWRKLATLIVVCSRALLQAAGARVVPIMYDMTEQELQDRFRAINGLLLPGGGADLRPGHPFYDTAAKLVQLAIDANDKGDYFPVS
jgi:gamma-glutamyl hydrolase